MSDRAVRRVEVASYRVTTPAPEADGTATWDATEVEDLQRTELAHQTIGARVELFVDRRVRLRPEAADFRCR